MHNYICINIVERERYLTQRMHTTEVYQYTKITFSLCPAICVNILYPLRTVLRSGNGGDMKFQKADTRKIALNFCTETRGNQVGKVFLESAMGEGLFCFVLLL
jgi:hypothetical protein